MAYQPFSLRRLPFGGRVAFSFLMAVVGGGYVSALYFMIDHHQGRDGREGLTVVDVEGVYHGTVRPAIFAGLLEDGHPEEIDPEAALDDLDRDVLLEWLRGEDVAANWSNIDFGDGYGSPQEIVATTCAGCHGPTAALEKRAEPELTSWNDYQDLALEKEIKPNETDVLLASTHTHSIAMGTITMLMVLLGYATRLPRFLVSLASFAASAGLALDIASWWLARDSAGWVTGIVAGGAAHAGGMALLFVFVFLDLWFPGGRSIED